MNDKKRSSIQLKPNKAKLLLSEIPIWQQHKLNATIINRLYYACYHATRALLLTKDLIPKTHTGVIAMLHKHFVLEGLFDISKAAFFNKLLQERIDDDYSDFLIVEDDTVTEYLAPAKDYITYIEQLLSKDENNP